MLVTTKLRSAFIKGSKWCSTRNNSAIIQQYRRICAAGLVMRVQKNWAFDTILGWAKILYISQPGTPWTVVTKRVIKEAGCGSMPKEEYINTFLKDEKTGQTSEEVVSIHFQSLWTREGDPIPNLNID
jgi:hypothetical protein